jgi:hypothetical protein
VNLGRLIGALVPESPARTTGEQLRLTLQWQRELRDLPTTPERDPQPDHPERED